jgi:hypothetical protein
MIGPQRAPLPEIAYEYNISALEPARAKKLLAVARPVEPEYSIRIKVG